MATVALCLEIRGDNAAAGTMGSVAVWLVIQHSRVSSRRGIPESSNNSFHKLRVTVWDGC